MSRPPLLAALALAGAAGVLSGCTTSPSATSPSPTSPATTAAARATATTTPSATATATASATATTTSPGSATPATASSAAAPVAGQSSGATSAAAEPALTQTYCIPTASLCFHYPAGYQVVKDPTPQSQPQGGEYGHLTDPQGNTLLSYNYFETAGVAGMNSLPDSPEQLVVRAQKTAASADLEGPKPISATTLIVQDDKGYFPRQCLTTESRATQPGNRFRENIVNYSTIYDVRYASKHTLQLTTRTLGNGTGPKEYATQQEAQQALANPVDDLVYRILSSAESK